MPSTGSRLRFAYLAVMVVALAGAVASCGGVDPTVPTTDPSTDGATASTASTAAASGETVVTGQPDRAEAIAPPRFGVAVSRADPTLIADIERRAGSDVGIVRVFARWDSPFPTAAHRELLASGRPLHLSIRPRSDGGDVVPWADIAAAEVASPIHDRLVGWAEAIAPYGSQLYITFNHEPETSDSAANGTPSEFVAAWRRTVEIFEQHGAGDAPTVLVLGRGAYADRSISAWYPGDDVVDVVGVDVYNWYDCQGTGRPWADPGDLLAPALAFAAEHAKPLAVPEVASTEDMEVPGRKADWIDDLSRVVEEAARRQPITFVTWFSAQDRSWPRCRWEHDSSAQASAALSRAVNAFATGPTGG